MHRIIFYFLVLDAVLIRPAPFAWNTMTKALNESPIFQSNQWGCSLSWVSFKELGFELENFTYPFILKTCGLRSILQGLKELWFIPRLLRWVLIRVASSAFGVARQVFDDCERGGFLGFHYFWIYRICCLVCPFSASIYMPI